MSKATIPDIPVAEQPPSITAAAHAYQIAMNQQSTTPTSTASPTAQIADMPKDVVMSDNTPDRPAVNIYRRLSSLWKLIGTQSPAILPGATVSSPAPPRVGTPSRNVNGNDNSRAASQHPDPPTMPNQAPPHGAPTRQYLNSKVTGVLLDGMKQLAKEQ